ncbi:hypothetical protein BRC19_02685 [Candidatus Saccharibacteria bacterium QS_5_54_17]|nr:MAG: hypothetical protein BRC19_02685 [Candidatus Saccharibacteria bacterium QS_5_54_17]
MHMNLQRWLILAGLLIGGLLVYLARADILEAYQLLRETEWWILLLVVPIQFVNYIIKAQFHRSMLSHFGYAVSLWRLFGLNWAIFFMNITLPTVGLSSVPLMGTVLRNDDVPPGKSTLVYFSKYAITYASYIFILLFGVLTLYFAGDIAAITIRFTVLLGVAIIGVSVFGLFALYDQRAFDWVVYRIQRVVDWISRKFRRGKELIGAARIKTMLVDFYDGFHQVMRNRAYLKQPFWWGLAGNVAELAILFVVFWALGVIPNPGVVVIAYAFANGAGFLSVIPGDFGVYEIVMVAVLSAAGVPLSVGVSATLLYRVVVKFAFLPIGFYFYTTYIREVPSGQRH